MKQACLTLLLSVLFSTLIADPYPKNPLIDILHYKFEFILSDQNDKIKGKTTISFLAKSNDVKTLRLDLASVKGDRGMRVDGVTSANEDLRFTHEEDVLLVTLPEDRQSGATLNLSVVYSGIPAAGLKIGPNKYGDRTFFSDNWPNKARQWLPTVDHPYDKASSEMIVTAPSHYQIISNGLLVEESNVGGGQKQTHWKQSVPISCWLYVLGVAEFAVQYVDQFEGKSIQTWVYPQDRDAGFYDFAVPTKHCLEFFSDYVGPFVYEKLANIQSNSVGGGMEAATAILYGDRSVTGERSTRWRNVIIHEVAHQWFGNAVTEYSWDDVWLSEGFATYFTLLFREHAYGREDFVSGLKNSRERVYNFYRNNKNYRIVHDNLQDMSKVTTGQTYQKGAWVLHMLRDIVGDENFNRGIRQYYSKYLNATASTSDFQREMEAVSGINLDSFYNQWLYRGGQIVLDGEWNYQETNSSVSLSLNQVQNDGHIFSFPIEVGVYYEGIILPDIHRLQMSQMQDQFQISVDSKPVKVVLDPRTVLLAEWTINTQ